MPNKPNLLVEKRRATFFKKTGDEIKKDLREIKSDFKRGVETIREFFFGPRKIVCRKFSDSSKFRAGGVQNIK
jgi:hypothetical protein